MRCTRCWAIGPPVSRIPALSLCPQGQAKRKPWWRCLLRHAWNASGRRAVRRPAHADHRQVRVARSPSRCRRHFGNGQLPSRRADRAQVRERGRGSHVCKRLQRDRYDATGVVRVRPGSVSRSAACSHLFVDEAHHVEAETWRQIRDEFSGRPVLQVHGYAVPRGRPSACWTDGLRLPAPRSPTSAVLLEGQLPILSSTSTTPTARSRSRPSRSLERTSPTDAIMY